MQRFASGTCPKGVLNHWGAVLLALAMVHFCVLPAFGERVRPMPDQILVKFRQAVSDDGAMSVLRPLRGQHLGSIRQIGVRVIRVPAASRDAVLRALSRNPKVEFAEADAWVDPDIVPNDPSYGTQWHLPKIAMPAAWDHTTGSSSVIVAVIDSGVDATHPELSGLMVPGWNFYNNNSDTTDVYGHGTSVAGAAVARGNNGAGIASVTWQCKIMPVRVSNTSGSATYSAMASGITFAADHGARVANVSYAGAARSATVQTAANYMAGLGGLVTASAGNDAVTYTNPDHPSILAVSATTSTDALASFSSKGPFVDVAAPGQSIYTLAKGGGYRSVSGTSLSAPIAAGVAALMFSVNPDLTPAEAQSILKSTAKDLGTAGYDTSFGYGRIEAFKAVQAAISAAPATQPAGDTTAPQVTLWSPGDGSTLAGPVIVEASAEDDSGVTAIEVYLNGEKVGSDASGTIAAEWDTAQEANGTHTITVLAYDAAGNCGQVVCTVTVDNPADCTPPAVAVLSPAAGGTLVRTQKVTVAASDASGIARLDLLVDGTLLASQTGDLGLFTFSWNTSKVSRGTHTLEAVAYDAAGNMAVSAPVTVVK